MTSELVASRLRVCSDFEGILVDARRQEQIDQGNRGEFALAKAIYDFFRGTVMPLIQENDWVFEAASTFASEHAIDALRLLHIAAREVWTGQTATTAIVDKAIAVLSEAERTGTLTRMATEEAASTKGLRLAKSSDLPRYLALDRMTSKRRSEVSDLVKEAERHERLVLLGVLRAVRDAYETLLPRLMYVVRRVIKVERGLKPTQGDGRLVNPSQAWGCYSDWLPAEHALHPILVTHANFYKTARNVGNHHEGLGWDPIENQVILKEDSSEAAVRVCLHDFQRWYRHLAVYLCDYGIRGIVCAYCSDPRAHDRDELLGEYELMYRPNFEEWWSKAYHSGHGN